ncbi:hypothetical protein V2647_14670 [Tenacibaculum maritimum]|uniref:hypothetical protein n=1 Tax=Tenacibaculum maritimum TaxID=107401 RepID=UPI001330DDC1|nr:hypothetical protein [Tenacibaculum maritimum]
MKRVLFIASLVLTSFFLQSCENDLEIVEELYKQNELYSVDRTKIVRPGNQGGN